MRVRGERSDLPVSAARVAASFLRRRGFERPDTDEELTDLAGFLASQVDSMDDATVAFATYVGLGVRGDRQAVIAKLLPKLVLSYRARLVGWFEHALVKRANLGGGGTGIKKLEEGLATWANAIPDIIAARRAFKLSDYLPSNEYLDPEMLDRVAQRAVKGVSDDAAKAGVLGMRTARAVPFEVKRDERGVWYIPPTLDTYEYKEDIKAHGFKWNVRDRRWETEKLTPKIRTDFKVDEPRVTPPVPAPPPVLPAQSAPERLRQWYVEEWLPHNVERLTRVFTDYARGKQTSYKVFFRLTSSAEKPVEVKFDRDIDKAWEAVEELRYRYVGRQGREPWLEVLDQFVNLVRTTSTAQLPRIIDRINNLQHSNGLFMEHFPSSVKAWYEGFLNAKYHTPRPDELAKFIPDRDVRNLMIEVARTTHRPAGWAYTPPPAYDKMKKELVEVGQQVNWREKGYPRYKGEKGLQPDRFDPEVQGGLDVLKRLHAQRESLLSTEPETPAQYEKWQGDVVDWAQDYERAREDVARMVEEERRRMLDDPSHSAEWEAVNFPKEFLEKFPYSVPGVSRSELAPFLVRHASPRRVAAWYLFRHDPAAYERAYGRYAPPGVYC